MANVIVTAFTTLMAVVATAWVVARTYAILSAGNAIAVVLLAGAMLLSVLVSVAMLLQSISDYKEGRK